MGHDHRLEHSLLKDRVRHPPPGARYLSTLKTLNGTKGKYRCPQLHCSQVIAGVGGLRLSTIPLSGNLSIPTEALYVMRPSNLIISTESWVSTTLSSGNMIEW